ncbi:MAG: LPP20 family lipoprotein [Selenomonas sp.]|nr:LPP20 family lipoprotein [Selenomonas sp.]
MKQIGRLLIVVGVLLLMMVPASAGLAAGGMNWENNVIRVTGSGVAPANARTPAQARMLARRAAIVDGYRQMAESAQGVKVDSETTVQNMMLVNDEVKTKVRACIQGARIISEQALPDGGYEVTMEVSVFGVSGLAQAVMPKPAVQESFPAPAPDVIPSVPADSMAGGTTVGLALPAQGNSSMDAVGGFTGLIVDCRGMGLNPVMSPVIKNDREIPVYGHKNLDYDKVVLEGMAAYVTDISRAVRAGSHPLMVRAIRLMDHNANPVISTDDANRVLIENGATGFLGKTAVVFLR